MLVIVLLYAALIWLIFFRFKWLPFNWVYGTLSGLLGISIVVVFLGLLSYLTPSGKIEMMGKVNEVTPNVSGRVTEIPVQRNVLVKAGTTLFQIDRTPFEYKVRQLEAALAEARQKVEQLKAAVDVAVADVRALSAQWERAEKRREDLDQLAQRQATSQFNLQDATAQANSLAAQLDAAKAREISAQLAASSDIEGENTAVAQLSAQLDYAQWELEQTTIRTSSDGYVSASTLAIGDRAAPTKSAMAFIVVSEIEIIGIFPQNGFQTIRPGAVVKLVFSNSPGRIYEAQINEILRGVGEGQFAASGVLTRVGSVGLTSEYPARISLPKDLDPATLRLGMAGSATVFSDHAGPIGVLASILLLVKAYALYI
jgi:multidrug resistance efflux pump